MSAHRTCRLRGTGFHVRFLLVEGKKMSKSEGNFYTLRDLLLKGYRASAIRFSAC